MKTYITPEDFTRIKRDVNGNPRYVCHFLRIYNHYCSYANRDNAYNETVKLANKIGGRKYHTKSYNGHIVFQSHNLYALCESINELLNGHDR